MIATQIFHTRCRPSFLMSLAALALVTLAPMTFAQSSPWEWTDVGRIVALGDVHGRYGELVLALKSTGLVDEELAWTGGKDHLVLCGDLINRGHHDRPVLDLARRLQREAESAGGRVHVVLGNHEVMNLVRNFRYVSESGFAAFASEERDKDRQREWKEYRKMGANKKTDEALLEAAFVEDYPPGYFGRERAFSLKGDYGKWLIEQPAVIKINEILFTHGGLTPETASLGLKNINETVREAIRDFMRAVGVLEVRVRGPANFKSLRSFASQTLQRASQRRKQPTELVEAAKQLRAQLRSLGLAPHGPLWYRGNSLANERFERDRVDAVLERLEAKAMMVGHSVTRDGNVTTRFKGRLYRLDVGLGYGRNGLALVFDGDRASVVDPRTGALSSPVVEPPQGQGWTEGVVHLPDAQLEMLLSQAEVVKETEIAERGVHVLELEAEGQKLRAVFMDNDKKRRSMRNASESRYQHELAAYWLDRKLGLYFIPTTVARVVDGKAGMLQPVVETALDLVSIRSYGKLETADADEIIAAVSDYFELEPGELQEQVVEARVFDALIGNTTRRGYERLFIPAEGRIALVGHDCAFPSSGEATPMTPCSPMPPDLTSGLMMLDREELRTHLGDYLSNAQIDALLERRDRVLAVCNPSSH